MAEMIYKSREHSERFKASAELLDFEIPYSVDELVAAKDLVVAKNNLTNCYVRPVAWRGSEMMAVAAQNATIHVAIAVWDWPSMFDIATKMKGIKLDIAEYRRPDPACAPCASKAAGLYMICTISKHRAERRGYADAMMLDWQGRVAECTGANILFTKDGEIHTPIADCFLDGITRQTVIGLARRAGDQGHRAPHHARGAGKLRRMLHLRHGRRGHAGRGDRPLQVHARRDLPRPDRGLYARSPAAGRRGFGRHFALTAGDSRQNVPPCSSHPANRMALKLVFLALMEAEPRHGYDLIREIETRTGGAYAPSPGIVYPTLTLLEDIGHIEAQASEGAKRQFALSETGKSFLADHRREADTALARLDALGERARPMDAGPIARAMQNLKTALGQRLSNAPDKKLLFEVADLIDEAARKIERL